MHGKNSFAEELKKQMWK